MSVVTSITSGTYCILHKKKLWEKASKCMQKYICNMHTISMLKNIENCKIHRHLSTYTQANMYGTHRLLVRARPGTLRV